MKRLACTFRAKNAQNSAKHYVRLCLSSNGGVPVYKVQLQVRPPEPCPTRGHAFSQLQENETRTASRRSAETTFPLTHGPSPAPSPPLVFLQIKGTHIASHGSNCSSGFISLVILSHLVSSGRGGPILRAGVQLWHHLLLQVWQEPAFALHM